MLRGGQEVGEVDWSGVQGRHGSHQRKDVKVSHVYSLTDKGSLPKKKVLKSGHCPKVSLALPPPSY